MTQSTPEDRKVTIGSYLALAFAVVFFSGTMQTTDWYGIFDFTTLNGSFGRMLSSVSMVGDEIKTGMTTFRGTGGNGARDGFIFALGLVPTIMFALGVVNVLEHYGALDAARQLLTPLLRPLLGIPGNTGLALIASLQSTDAGAAMTRQLHDAGHITQRETNIFAMFQFCAGAALINFFSSGAVLFTLTTDTGEPAVASSMGLAIAVMLIFKCIATNLFRVYLNITEGKQKSNQPSDTQ